MTTRLHAVYGHLVGETFNGRYKGLKSDQIGQSRVIFKVDDDEEILGIFDKIRRTTNKNKRIWRGFSDASDSFMGYDWDLWILAPDDCALTGADAGASTFVITNVEPFVFESHNKYDFGVDIYVEPNEYVEDDFISS